MGQQMKIKDLELEYALVEQISRARMASCDPDSTVTYITREMLSALSAEIGVFFPEDVALVEIFGEVMVVTEAPGMSAITYAG